MTNSTSLVLVGWDDEKGRPIYSKKQLEPTSNCQAVKKKKQNKKASAQGTGKANSKHRRSSKNKNERRKSNIPTVQVAVSSLMTSSSADNADISMDDKINRHRTASKPTRKVSFSPTDTSLVRDTKRCDPNSSKLFVTSKRPWDRKQKSYGSRRYSRDSRYNITPVIVFESAGNNNVGWEASEPIMDRNDDDAHSGETEKSSYHEENENDAEDSDHSMDKEDLLSNNDDLEFSCSSIDIGNNQSVDNDSNNLLSLEDQSHSEQGGSKSSFSYGELDEEYDGNVLSPGVNQTNDSVPEVIQFETDNAVANEFSFDITVEGEDPSDSSTSNIDHLNNGTPSTKTLEEMSYNLHSGGSHDFVDYDFPLGSPDESNATRISEKGKRRSYGCSEKPLWVSNRQTKATSIAANSDQAVGWDDEKCRPVFRKKSRMTAEKDELNESVDADGDDVGGDVNMISHKRTRAYTTRFRKTSLTKAIENMSVLASPNQKDFDDDLNETNKGMCHGNDISMENEGSEENLSLSKSEGLDVEMEEDDDDGDNSHHIHPTDISSLEAARAFFRNLDSNHSLTIQNNLSSPRKSSEVIRTKRHIVHSDQLQAEYAEYCEMLAEAGVVPITINEFAKNWNLHFVGKGIRDGVFDED